MNIIQRDIFVTRKDITVVIPYPQGGNAVPIYLRIADWQIPSGSTARIYMRKPSGAEIYNDCVINGNIVQITVTTQMTAESGWVKSTLEIVNGTDILHSFEMTLDVQATSISDNAVESKDEFTALENLVAEADQAVKDAETATEAANTAAGTANTAAGAANTAAGTANTAAQAANTAAGTANTAADNADDAADLANTAAGAANTAAGAANTAAQEANDAADAANAAAGGDISNKTVTFTEAAEDTDIASGDTTATLFGKILKRFNTLKTTIQTILTNIGNLANLATTDKSSLVGAVNELNEDLAIKCSVGDVEDATLEKFVEYVSSLPKWTTSGRLKETIGWGPENRSTAWFRFWAAAQNRAGGSSSVDIQVILTQENHMWLGYIYGQGSYNVKWTKIV